MCSRSSAGPWGSCRKNGSNCCRANSSKRASLASSSPVAAPLPNQEPRYESRRSAPLTEVRVRYGKGELVSGIDVHGQREGERTHGQRHSGPGHTRQCAFFLPRATNQMNFPRESPLDQVCDGLTFR